MDVNRVRKDFPVLRSGDGEKSLVYLDSACQSLRPKQVIEAMARYYEEYPACAGRSVHSLATKVSIEVDRARGRIMDYCGADDSFHAVFVKNCTEALNTVLFGLGLKRGDRVLATDREHNSVHVPLMILKESVGIDYSIVRSRKDETFDIEEFKKSIGRKTRLVAMCHTSNVNGTTLPAKEVCEIAHDHGASVLLDGAQFAPYGAFGLKSIDADCYAFSCHKMCGPSGLGVLIGKSEMLEEIRPLMYGGHGVGVSTRNGVELLGSPEKFETGLQNYAGIIGAGAASEYLTGLGRREILEHVGELNSKATRGLSAIKGMNILRPEDPGMRSGILGFNLEGYRPHDVAMILDETDRIMIRSGMHCVHTWFQERGIDGSARASFYLYNDADDVERLVGAVGRISSR